MNWSDAQSTTVVGSVRYADGITWAYVSGGITENDASPRTSDPSLISSVVAAYGAVLRQVSAEQDCPIELLIAAIALVAERIGATAAASYVEYLPGFVSDEATPELVYAGCTGLRLDRVAAVGRTQRVGDYLALPMNAITAAALHIVATADHTRFQPPMVAAAYNSDGLRFDATSRWRMAGQEQIDRFVAWFNTAVRAIQFDGSIAGAAPNYTTMLARIPVPTSLVPTTPVSNSWNLRRPESIAFVSEGMMTVCMTNPGMSALWSVDPATLDQIKSVAQDAKAGMGLPKGASMFAYPDFGGTMRIMTEKEVIALYMVMRDFVNDVMYFDTGRAPTLPGQPVLLSP